VSGEKLYDGNHLAVELRDGKEVVVHGPAVAIVAVDGEDRVVLVRQHRPGAGGPLLELPAGNLDEGEEPEDAARRELAEETGLHGGEWAEVAAVYTSPGFCDERMHVFVADGLAEGDAHPDGSEELEVVRVPVTDLPALLGEVEDAKTLAGLLVYLRNRGRRQRSSAV
jgi:ADP-ribose pyrophosphatase